MNREILFRALKDDMSNCNFVYGQLVYDAIGCPRITQVDSSGHGLIFHTCLKNTESQFSGLKDKNGNKIFEGDIVQDFRKSFKYKCVFRENGAFEFQNLSTLNFVMHHEIWEDEIIGNVIENTELQGVS